MVARILRPARNAMQSGKAKTKKWVLVHEASDAKEIDPLMGYTSTDDTRTQIKLSFDTLEDAENYARRNGIAYTVQAPHDATPKRVSYSDNFRNDRRQPWTH